MTHISTASFDGQRHITYYNRFHIIITKFGGYGGQGGLSFRLGGVLRVAGAAG